MITRPLKGIIPVVITTLKKDKSIDIISQKKLIKFLQKKKVGGFWCLGTGSEDMNLSFKKRLQLAKVLCQSNDGKLPLVLGAGFFCLEETYEFIDSTKKFNFDAYHIMPYNPKLGINLLKKYYIEIADYSPKPIWMYTSANWCQHIKPDFVEELCKHKNIAGIKYSSSNTTDQLKVISLQNKKFQVITAVASQLFASLAMGSIGSTSSLASALPEVLNNIYNVYSTGNMTKALRLQRDLIKFLKLLPQTIKKDNFLGGAEEKYILSLRNICKPIMTDYYRSLNKTEMKQVDLALKQSGYIEYL